MREQTKRKWDSANEMIERGFSVSEACRKTGLPAHTFYNIRSELKKRQAIGTTSTAPTTGSISAETPLEEQVIASNLSSKAKVKILSTLLNG